MLEGGWVTGVPAVEPGCDIVLGKEDVAVDEVVALGDVLGPEVVFEDGEAKAGAVEGDSMRTTVDGLQRKVQLLEEQLDAGEKNLKETVEK